MAMYRQSIIYGFPDDSGRSLTMPTNRCCAITELDALGDDPGSGDAGLINLSDELEASHV